MCPDIENRVYSSHLSIDANIRTIPIPLMPLSFSSIDFAHNIAGTARAVLDNQDSRTLKCSEHANCQLDMKCIGPALLGPFESSFDFATLSCLIPSAHFFQGADNHLSQNGLRTI